MLETLNHWNGEVIIMGDFNEARFASERHGSYFHSLNAAEFNMFIANSQLIDIPLGAKFLKQRLKEWSCIKRRNKDHDKKVIQDSLIKIDLRRDKGNGLPGDLTKRANLFRDLKDIDHKDSIDLAQKAKIKWAVEGDENSKFFHGIVNKKRRHLAIKARKEQLLMFKVDFQKAFDSVRCDHLDDNLRKYGFGIKWHGWIRGCLQSSKASVLVNGS
nr:RNA-directed DNA polymerase, eukaryota [Tanacetum cinerariifolium]